MEKMQWFKFSISEWKMGKIQRCKPEAKSAFMELCCLYWINETKLSIEDAIIECDEDNYQNLLSKKVIKEVDGYIKIYFLDEQFENVLDKSEKARESVKKRWLKRNATVLESNYESDTNVLPSNYERNTEEKRTEEEEEQEEKNNIIESFDFDGLLVFINSTFGKNFKLINDKVKKKYKALIKQGYDKKQIIQAMVNAKENSYHKETGYQYCTPEFFSRTETIDKYSEVAVKQKSNNMFDNYYGLPS